ncbi:MAG: periplasmic heavy metal sensor [Alphaproteobacteria bacterium]
MRWFSEPRPRLLFGALALNLFFVGLAIAAIGFGALRPAPMPPPVRHIVRAAGPEARPLIEQALAARKDALRDAGKALKATRRAYKDALTAETIDSVHMRKVMTNQRAARQALHILMEEALVEVLPKLSPEARKKLAERRRRGKRRPPRHN